MCGGIFKYGFVANLPMSLSVKKFQKSVNIWGSYGQEFSVLIFLTHGVLYNGSKLGIRSAVCHMRLHVATCIFRLDGLPVTF